MARAKLIQFEAGTAVLIDRMAMGNARTKMTRRISRRSNPART